MHTFIMHTQYSPDTLSPTQSQEDLERHVVDHIRSEFPQIEWVNVVILGPHDYLDVFRAPDMNTALKVATLIRTLAHAHTEVWQPTELGGSKGLVRPPPSGKE